MTIPQSFIRDGFYNPAKPRQRRRLMIGQDGPTQTGKTEFMLSAPGPSIIVALDPGWEGMIEKTPEDMPPHRIDNYVIHPMRVLMEQEAQQPDYVKNWVDFRDTCYKACRNEDALTLGIDGDSDGYELEELAEFGKRVQVPQMSRGPLYAKRRLFIRKLFDSGKNILATNKVKVKYVPVIDPKTGEPLKDDQGRIVKEASNEMERRGFPDQDYLYQVQIRHLYKKGETRIIPAGPRKGQTVTTEGQFGIRIMKCKIHTKFEGMELWGDKCNFMGLVELLYPQTDQSEWGL